MCECLKLSRDSIQHTQTHGLYWKCTPGTWKFSDFWQKSSTAYYRQNYKKYEYKKYIASSIIVQFLFEIFKKLVYLACSKKDYENYS